MFVETLMSGLAQEANVTEIDGQKFNYSGTPALVDVKGNHLLIVFKTGSRHRVLLAPETDYTRQADLIGVHVEGKSGRATFDERYVIRADDATASALFDEELIAKVEALEPFLELEMSPREYRLLKERPEDPGLVRKDLAALAVVVEATRA